MKLITRVLAALCLIVPAACYQETPSAEEPLREQACTVSLTLEKEPLTRSILPSDIENRLDNAFVLIQGSEGFFRYRYFDFTSASEASGVDWRLPAGMDYTVYAVGNMGNVLPLLPRAEAGFDMAAFRFEVPPYGSLRAMPMARQLSLSSSRLREGENVSLSISLQRLMAKVCVNIDKSGITGGEAAQAMQSGSLHLRQVARALYPFRADGSRALSGEDIFPGNTDYYSFSAAEAWNLGSGEITLYLPENRQGTGTGSTQSGKVPTGSAAGRANFATYLEYAAVKSGTHDGVAGNMTYRAYLGENETNNFDVIGDKVYSATLSLSWNGMWEGTWRVAKSDWADNRELVISRIVNGKSPMGTSNTKAGSEKVRKGTPTAFYLNFFPTGTGGSVAHGRKDLGSWPYGFQVLVDGTALGSGTSGTIKNASNQDLIAWSYNATNDCLSMETIPGSPASADIHTLQLRTLDGRKASPTEYFTTSIPFEFRWVDDGTPDHVAQRGLLQALDADTHAVDADGVFHVKSGYSSKIRLTDNNEGTAVVELIDGFTALADAIYIEDADGDRHCDVPLEARVPWWECTNLGTSFVDQPQVLTFTYFPVTAGGAKDGSTPMQVKKGLTVATGLNLSADLVEELIAPVTTSPGGKLGVDRSLTADGTFELFTYIATYSGLEPSGDEFVVDKEVVSMGLSSKAAHETTFTAYNPWKFVSNTPVSGPLMNDYTLYRVPARSGTTTCRAGWNANPSDAPSETTSKTVQVRNVVVFSPRNLKLDAKFQDGSGYIGEKIATGTPGIVSPTYTETTSYQLRVRLTNSSDFDWKAIGDYLYFDHGHWGLSPEIWMSPTTTDAIRRASVVSLFDDNSNELVLTGYHSPESEAWSYAAKGVTQSNPTAIRGVQFFTVSQTVSSNWNLTYSMNGLTSEDIVTHGAGKLDVVLKIVNPYNPTGATLDKKVSEAFMRLHLWVWASVTEVTKIAPPYVSGSAQGWAYKAFPYVFTDGKPITAINGLFNKTIFKPQAETYTNASTTYLRGYAASVSMGGDYYGRKGEAVWQFRNDNTFQDSWSDAKKRSELMGVLSAVSGNSVFTFRATSNENMTWPDYYGPGQPYTETITGLNSILGGDNYFYRANSTTLYYDPSGAQYKYTIDPTNYGTNKLFVIHIGETTLAINPYFFDPANGYVNP